MLRSENRKEDALRPVEIITNYTSNPDGSVLIACGNTKVLCTAIIEEKVPSFLRGSGRGWVTSEYSLLPGSTVGRTVREASRGKVSGRTSEIQRLIGRSLRSIIDMEALGEKTVWIDCDVIQADGGTRTASITGGYAALYIASRKLVSQGKAAEALCRDAVAAVSVGIIDGRAVLDLDYAEDSRADVDMNVIMTGSGDFVEIQGTAEGKTFTADELREMLRLAKKGIMELIEFQNQAIAQIELK